MNDERRRAADALRDHLAAPAGARDAKWRHRFYDLIEIAPLCERDPRMFVGRDGFPYYALNAGYAGDGEPVVTVPALIDVATTRGFGIAIEPDGDEAAWVFTCGDLVTKRAFKTWEFPRVGVPAGAPIVRSVVKDPAALSIGAPSATLLPPYVQPLLRRYFTHSLRVSRPGALAVLSPQQEPREHLVFRLAREDFARDEDFERALAGIAWFLPRHITIAVLPAEVLATLERAFVPLLG